VAKKVDPKAKKREFLSFKVVGVGGIGGHLAPNLCRYLNYGESDSPVKVSLIDGDSFEPKNLIRQNCGWDDVHLNKAMSLATKLDGEFEILSVEGVPEYVVPDNVKDIIVEGDVVFAGLDNFKSRKLIADRCEELENVTLISGGNELTDGNVQVFIKRGGKKLTANLHEYHPEIEHPRDKRPDELGCAKMMAAAPQLLFMNATIAALMLNALYTLQTIDKLEDMYGEVYTDILEARTLPDKRVPQE
jgi:molybdopterin/thiamine biosynthesis adenylyltransferase